MSLFENSETFPDLRFSTNWNNKLNCKCFTTIRLANKKYAPGERFTVWLNKERICNVRVVSVEEMYLNYLKEATAMLDTGYSLEVTKDIISKMYAGKGIDFTKTKIVVILLEKIP